MEEAMASTDSFMESFPISSSSPGSDVLSSTIETVTFNSSRYEDTAWDQMASNDTLDLHGEREYIFDRLYVRVIFILVYTIVFCFCFFGNLMVILVVTLHWRMRNITKFCLANLAFADLCVGVFCVYQNLSTYLINSWVLGEFLCKMYQFINALSHTASILILVVICVERYLAILHPFRCKQMLTIKRLRGLTMHSFLVILQFLIVAVWMVSAVYCSPRLYYITTVRVYNLEGEIEIICTAKRILYDSKTFDMIHFFMLFLLPLLVISILYTRVGITLWQSSKNRVPWTTTNLSRSSSGTVNEETPTNSRPPSVKVKSSRDQANTRTKDLNKRESGEYFQAAEDSKSEKRPNGFQKNRNSLKNAMPSSPSFAVTIENKCYVVGPNETKIVNIEPEPSPSSSEGANDKIKNNLLSPNSFPSTGRYSPGPDSVSTLSRGASVNGSWRRDGSCYKNRRSKKLSKTKNLRNGREALKSRQTVVRMLIVIVVTFAVCNFPFHLRKMFQYWWPNYDYGSIFSTLVTPITHLIMYANCAINPIIYAFMSKTFRSSFKDLLCLRLRKPFQSVGYNNHEQTAASQIVSMKSFRRANTHSSSETNSRCENGNLNHNSNRD